MKVFTRYLDIELKMLINSDLKKKKKLSISAYIFALKVKTYHP